jgi:RNA polymerase sigma-70 factor (ECF subfamily)
MIDEGRRQLRLAAASGRPPGAYRLQAEIAECHATAPDAASTPWARIVDLFDALLVARPSPVIALNRAIAMGFRDGYATGLGELGLLDGLDGYPLLPAARGDFLRRLGRRHEAHHAYAEALALTPHDTPEHRFLARRLLELTN